MPDEGDRGIVFSSGSPFSSFVEVAPAQEGDKVVLYNLSNGDRLAVPSLDLLLGGQAWVTPSFDFAGFDWRIDFDFLLIPLELGAGYYTIRYLGDDYIQDDVKGNWVADALIGKYVHIVAGANAGQYFQIIDNGTDWISIDRSSWGTVNGGPESIISSIPVTNNMDSILRALNWAAKMPANPGYWMGESVFYSSGGPTSGYVYISAFGTAWPGYYVENDLVFGSTTPISPGGIQFYYKTISLPGTTLYNIWFGTYPTRIGGYINLPETNGQWKVFSATCPSGAGNIIFRVGAGGQGAKLSVANISQTALATLAQMGFALGNLFEIVDTIP